MSGLRHTIAHETTTMLHMAKSSSTQLQYTNDENTYGFDNIAGTPFSSSFVDICDLFLDGGEMVTIVMNDHRPLGCTVEESLHEENNVVFVSKITADGHAEQAGLQVGDVLVAVTGAFGKMTPVINSDHTDVKMIKQLVCAVPDEEPISFQVVRGTNVLERHESKLIELCDISGIKSKEIENDIMTYIAGGYIEEFSNNNNGDKEEELDAFNYNEKEDDIINSMMNLWADELSLPPLSGTNNLDEKANIDKITPEVRAKPKPWSVRSSPSGTWVRDPKTGKMQNIDK